MKNVVKISGLDCPNCAKSLEGEINKIDGITNAHIEFVQNKMFFDCDDFDLAYERIVELSRELEPNAKIEKIGEKREQKIDLQLLRDVIFIILGIGIGIVIFFVKMPTWCYWTLYVLAALLLGYKTYIKAFLLLMKGKINENLLITISVVGASIISEHMEGLMVIALYSIGKVFESLAVNKSRKSIEKLAKLQPEYANLILDDGNIKKVKPEEVEIGDKVLVRSGEKVALDGKITQGSAFVDMQNISGESTPIQLKEGDEIWSGAVVMDSAIVIETTSLYENSTISKIMNLTENASENKSKTETFISKITKWYTLGIILLAVAVWGIVWVATGNFNTAIYRGLIFLVISCPCAFAISVPLSYFSGLGNASKNGILIKGSNYLDACARLDLIAFDKTGTLTSGKFKIEKISCLDKNKSEEEVLFLASLGEQYSIHPLAQTIVSSCGKKLPKIEGVKEIAGKGVEFLYKNSKYFVGRRQDSAKNTAVEIYENDIKIGEIELSDTIKHTATETCKELNQMGIETVLLSGDNKEIVEKVANKIGINKAIGKLLPQDKYNYIDNCRKSGKKVGYVGDGINDAPSLALADVGISMGINGAGASIETSDVVLVDDNPLKIINAIKISRFTRKIVIENIAFSAIVKILFLALGSAGITGMLVAVFADVGVTLLAILNSMRVLKFNAKRKIN